MSSLRPINRFRLFAAIVAAVVVIGLVAGAIVFTSRFQTWAVRRVLADHPEFNVTVGRVHAGWQRITLQDVRWEPDGLVVVAPEIEADLSLFKAVFGDQYMLSRLRATGWTATLTTLPVDPVAFPNPTGPTETVDGSNLTPGIGNGLSSIPAAAALGAGATLHAFAGVFGYVELPIAVAFDNVELDGVITLPDQRGRAEVVLQGGELKSGGVGTFEIRVRASLADPIVDSVDVRGTLRAGMDTPRTFDQLALTLDAVASGPGLPDEVTLMSDVAAARAATQETYSVTLTTRERTLLSLRADFPYEASRITGTWVVDVRDTDVAPFTLGHTLPSFIMEGEGRFDTDPSFSAVHVFGQLAGSADHLEILASGLEAVGPTTFAAEFDVAQRGPTISVHQFEAKIGASRPVATVRSLQAFEFDAGSGTLVASDPLQDLFGVQLEALPAVWAGPLVSGAELTGGVLKGEVLASSRAGGIAVRSRTPLTVEGLSFVPAGRTEWRDLTLTFNANADYTPLGWQAEVTGLSALFGTTPLLLLDAKAGKLRGRDQALKAAGKVSGNLATLLHLAGESGDQPLTSANASVEFVTTIAGKTEIHAQVALRDLVAEVAGIAQRYPTITTTLRADVTADGGITMNAPIVLEQDGRRSDLTLLGTLGALQEGSRALQGQITSTQLVLDDAKVLAALIPRFPAAGGDNLPPVDGPPWAGWHGALLLQLKRVLVSETFEISDIGGRVRLDAGSVKLEAGQAQTGVGGQVAVSGELAFDPTATQRYHLTADVELSEFDPGPLLRGMSGGQPPMIEGNFEVTGTLTGRANEVEDLPGLLGGAFKFASKGGIFRGLPIDANNLAETSSRIAAFISSAGAALGALTGRRDYLDIANKAEAVAELARGLSAIKFDQLHALLVRDPAMNTTVREFTVISPELRLTGEGMARHTAGTSWADDSLAFDFVLRARGRNGELLRYLGLLEAQVDDLGYAACTIPVRVRGTVGSPDATEFSDAIASLALEKSGLTEKAAEFLNRIRGSGKQ